MKTRYYTALSFDDIRPVYAQMKEVTDSKNVRVMGGCDLSGQFFDAVLLDEFIVQIGSVSLGLGKPVFPRRAAPKNGQGTYHHVD